MRIFLVLVCLLFLAVPAQADSASEVVEAARDRTFKAVAYNPAYVSLKYPGGDVPSYMGVCTDVIIRTYRKALNYDFQKAVHEDMKANFSVYPKIWGHSRADKNIDHRRVPNLETFLTRQGADLEITQNAKDYQPGDIVSWRFFRGGTAHIGIVTNRKSRDGTPLIVHNIGAGPEEDNILFKYEIVGHFRFIPDQNMSN